MRVRDRDAVNEGELRDETGRWGVTFRALHRAAERGAESTSVARLVQEGGAGATHRERDWRGAFRPDWIKQECYAASFLRRRREFWFRAEPSVRLVCRKGDTTRHPTRKAKGDAPTSQLACPIQVILMPSGPWSHSGRTSCTGLSLGSCGTGTAFGFPRSMSHAPASPILESGLRSNEGHGLTKPLFVGR